jgi:hypothetical protein
MLSLDDVLMCAYEGSCVSDEVGSRSLFELLFY